MIEQQRIDELSRQVHRLERQVAFLMKHVGVAYDDAPPEVDDVGRLILAGDKVGAIRLHVQKTGADLRSAQLYVNALADRLNR